MCYWGGSPTRVRRRRRRKILKVSMPTRTTAAVNAMIGVIGGADVEFAPLTMTTALEADDPPNESGTVTTTVKDPES